MKKGFIFSCVLLFVLTMFNTLVMASEDDILLYVNEEKIECDVAPFV